MSDEVRSFLELLWSRRSFGSLTLWTLPSRMSVHLPLADFAVCASAASGLDVPGVQVYFGCGSRRDGLPPNRRGYKADVVAVPGLWLDLDLAGPAHASKALPETEDDAAAILAAIPFEPTAAVHSGWGLHLWWVFAEPLVLEDQKIRADFDRTCGTFQKLAIDAAAARGWHVDDTSDLARVLRLPGTTNRKIPTDLRPVRSLFIDGPLHESYGAVRSKLVRPVGRPPKSRSEAPAVPEDRPVHPVDHDDLLRRLANVSRPESRELVDRMLACASLAEPGSRDETLQRAASILAYLEPWGEVEDLVAYLEPSLGIWASEPEAKLSLEEECDKARDKLRRSQADARRDRIAAERAEAGIGAAIARAAVGPRREDGYTDDELRRACGLQRLRVPDGGPEEALRRRWIVAVADTYYVLKDGDYLPPITAANLIVSLRRDLDRAPIVWDVVKADGGMRRKKASEIVDDYGTVARRVVVDLSLQNSWYDSAAEIFYEAPCPLRPLAPCEHPQVAAWLERLGGPQTERLLDWIATATQLSAPTCALYLSGPKGAGKTMLAQGLARLWTTGSATMFDQISGSWNSDLCRCPLVLADEHLPWNSKQGSGWLRAFIGATNRVLTRKYLVNAALIGSPRLILAANNDTMLVGDEDIGGDDLDAVASRFLHVAVSPSAAAYLEGIGSRKGTEDWVSGDAIARHALWLRDQRDVAPGGRFLVEGEVSAMHRRLTVNGRVASLVCEWLAKHVDKADPSVKQIVKTRVAVGNGHYFANATAIAEAWEFYIKSSSVPSTRAIGLALANLSVGIVWRDGVRMHDLRTEMILEEAIRCQIGDVDMLRSRIDGLLVLDGGKS